MDYQIPFSQLCFLSAELILYIILILIIFGQLSTEFLCRLISSRTWSKLLENGMNDSNFRSSFPQNSVPSVCKILVIVLLWILFSLKPVWQCMQYKVCLYLSVWKTLFSWWLLLLLSTSYLSALGCFSVIFYANLVSNLLNNRISWSCTPFSIFVFHQQLYCFLVLLFYWVELNTGHYNT